MTEAISTELKAGKVSVIEDQAAIAACIPEIEKLAWKFFVNSRDLDVAEKDEDFADEKTGPEHLRWSVAESALAMYYELLELIPYARKGAEATDASLLADWEKENKPRTRSCG